VVIVGGRYGSLDGQKSFTEKEYEYAMQSRIPVLAFIHRDPGKIEADKTDRDPDQIKRLEAFRARLRTSRIVAFWNDVHDLRTEVLTAVTNAVNLAPSIGWVRGDQAIDPKVLQEAERLRFENADLRSRLEKLEAGDLTFPEELVGPDDPIQFQVYPWGREDTGYRANVRIKDIFTTIFENILLEDDEDNIQRLLARTWMQVAKPDDFKGNTIYEINQNDVRGIRHQLEALGLIKAFGRTRTYNDFAGRQRSDNYIAWTLTDKGRRYMSHLNATRRNDDQEQA